jgi:hypothetical protein
MRTKTTHTVDTAAVSAAWDQFFKNVAPISKEQLNKEGWKTKSDMVDLGVNWRDVNNVISSSDLEMQKFRIKCGKLFRNVEFYRPKV